MSHEKVFHKQVRAFIDITGQRFGLLTAVSYVKYVNGSVWLFRCDCGSTITRVSRFLASPVNPPSCGCAGHPSRRKHWAANAFRSARHASARRGHPFDMTVEQFGELMSQPCHYCGGAPSTQRVSSNRTAHQGLRNGVDRVDSSVGYVEGNCVPCCCKCNRMKLDHSVTDFLDHVSAIHNHNLCVPNIIHIKHHAPPLIHPNSLVHAGSVAPLRAAAAGS